MDQWLKQKINFYFKVVARVNHVSVMKFNCGIYYIYNTIIKILTRNGNDYKIYITVIKILSKHYFNNDNSSNNTH